MGIIANKLAGQQVGQPAPTTEATPPQGGGIVSRALAAKTAQPAPEPGFVQGLAQTIAKPFERTIGGALNLLPGEDKAQREGIFGGTVDTLGYKDGQRLHGTELAKDVAGTGLELATYAIPGGAELKGLSLGAKVAKGAKLGAASGAAFGAGSALQDQKSLGETAVSAAKGGVAGAALGVAFPVAGQGVKALKDTFTTPTEKMLEDRLLNKFSKGIRPTITQGRSTTEGIDRYNKNVISAVKTISENEPNLVFTNADGEAVRGKVPTSIKELMEAGDQTKRAIFNEYDSLARQAGENGLQVDLHPIASELNGVINDKALQLSNPRAVDYAMQIQERLVRTGKIDATVAQDVIQNYNKSLEAFYRNPTYDNASNAAIDAMVANLMRKHLDDGIEGLTGKAYQELKTKYGALKAIEKDVIKAHLRDERKNIKGLIDFSDILSGGQVVHGILSLNPATIGAGLTQKAIAAFYKKMNDPNRAIQKVFEIANKLPAQAKKEVTPRLQLPAPTSGTRSEVYNQSVIPLGPKTQTRADEEMIAKFGQRSQTSQTMNPTANTPASQGDIASSMRNNKNATIPPTLAPKVEKSNGKGGKLPPNPQLGNRAAMGGIAGIETDDQGNVRFNPEKAAVGAVAMGAITSKGGQKVVDKIGEKVKTGLGYKETGNLTTKILKDLEGKTTVSKQYILDATNRGDLKQVERDLIRKLVQDEGNTVDVEKFANKVKAELLPLKRDPVVKEYYENIALPAELRGRVANYREHVYNSPIETKAGDVHFGDNPRDSVKGYFGHTRIEDMADDKTRRVIEVQSDLYQKGRMDNEVDNIALTELEESGLNPKEYDKRYSGNQPVMQNAIKRKEDVAKLQQYNDPTAHFRMVREEIKKAAEDGKTKLQFPTGETAMKIEGLGDEQGHWFMRSSGERFGKNLTPEDLKVGKVVQNEAMGTDYIITDVLGDGKFKAVEKSLADYYNPKLYKIVPDTTTGGEKIWVLNKNDRFVNALPETFSKDIVPDRQYGTFSSKERAEKYLKTLTSDEYRNNSIKNSTETFDISGKVDTSNPIYKFYEKDVQNYLKKFGGKKVVDDKGVSWVEVPIDKKYKGPIEAFGIAGGLGLGTQNNDKKLPPTPPKLKK